MKKSHTRKRRRSLGVLERELLEELTLGDMLYGMLLSARSTRLFYKLSREHAAARYRRKRAIERLIELEFIEKRAERLSITATGHTALIDRIEITKRLLETKTWDGKWRIVTFDIPEKYTLLRDKIRHILKRAGFVRLQHSVWIFPHECFELVALLKEESQLADHILYGVLERIENDGHLRKIFGLL